MPVPPEHYQPPPGHETAPRGVYREPWAVSPTTTLFQLVTSTGAVIECYVPEPYVEAVDALVDDLLGAVDPPVRPLKIVV